MPPARAPKRWSEISKFQHRTDKVAPHPCCVAKGMLHGIDLSDPRDDQNIGIDKRSAGCPSVAPTVAVAATNELRDAIINFNTLNRQTKCMFFG